MIEIHEAEALLQTEQITGKAVMAPIDTACGRVLATDLIAPEPVPRYTSSAMDGIAVRFPIEPERPVILDGEAAAGCPYDEELKPGHGVLISTGAMIPERADAVIPLEELTLTSDRASVRVPPKPRAHIREAGEEIRAGQLLFPKGTVLTPPALGLLASVGIITVPVYARPRIAIVTSGNEVVPPETLPDRHQLRNANATILKCMLHQLGMEPVAVTHVLDEPDTVADTLASMGAQADIILTTGGVSMGNHDRIRQAAEACGYRTVFWQVRQKPGKPVFFARTDHTALFGLPGNPLSALMGAVHYVLPYMDRFSGRDTRSRGCEALFTRPYRNKGDRHRFVLVSLEYDGKTTYAHPVSSQRSHNLSGPATADGYTILPPNHAVAGGERRFITLFPWRT